MNFTVNEITNSIAGKPSLSECTVEELRQLTHQYPFFGPAQFLFVKKMQEDGAWQLKEQIQKASLYFQNPLWFDHLLKTNFTNPADEAIQKEVFIPEPTAQMEIPVTHEEVVDQTMITREPAITQLERKEEENQPELMVEMPKFKFNPVDVSTTELTFEPYHTIDYFASQGIQPKLEEKPKDQFSRQLKSFTEWLKVMKRLPVTEIAAAVSVVEEKKVEKMAEISINDREVITEAMAEVWEKQGNKAKATEIYKKLSLLNPDKSSYFAAKIEQLKNL
jgi:hypothetical protein